MMADHWLASLPPVQGCLFCHSEGAVSVEAGRSRLARGGGLPVIRCSHCGAVAELDALPERAEWRIRYRKVNQADRYYYVAQQFGGGEWFDRAAALQISTNGYVQRQRVRQTATGDLSWLAPLTLDPLPPFINQNEVTWLELRGVTLARLASQTWILRSGQSEIIDSGKLYVTSLKLHLLGQRRDWPISWADVSGSSYDAGAWQIGVEGGDQPRALIAQRASNEIDPQLIVTVIEHLRQR